MPCREPSNEDILRAERQEDREKICHLEGVICAMLTELPNYNISVDQFISQCEKHGKIKIKDLWIKHQLRDKQRLIDDLEKYSQHEMNLLKEIIKNPRLIERG